MNAHDFHLAQYQMLREEIMQYIRDLGHALLMAFIGVGTAYTWLLLHHGTLIPRILWFVPSCIILVCGFRSVDLSLRIKAIAKYLRSVEEEILGNDAKVRGWERSQCFKSFGMMSSVLATSLWLIGFLGTIILSYQLSNWIW